MEAREGRQGLGGLPGHPEPGEIRHHVPEAAELLLDGLQGFHHLGIVLVHEKELDFRQPRRERVVQVVSGSGHDPEDPVQLKGGAFFNGLLRHLDHRPQVLGHPQGKAPGVEPSFPLLHQE